MKIGRKPTVTIGIAAYNEEGNIGRLLKELLSQRRKYFKLDKIIVVSDGSSDNTVEEVEKIKSVNVVCVDDGLRKGKSERVNEIVGMFDSDYLINIDADVLPYDKNVVDNLINPFLKNKNVGIVSGRRITTKAKTQFEEMINESVEFKLRIFENINNGNNLYLCFGGCRAFAKEFVKTLRWPTSISEDVYSYLFCIKSGYKFFYNPHAMILYKSPDNFHDHEKQSHRFKNGIVKMFEYFEKGFVKKEHNIPNILIFKSALEWVKKKPLNFIYYLVVLCFVRIRSFGKYDSSSLYDVSLSSKSLN